MFVIVQVTHGLVTFVSRRGLGMDTLNVKTLGQKSGDGETETAIVTCLKKSRHV